MSNLLSFLHNVIRLNWRATMGINYRIGGLLMTLHMPVKVYGKLSWKISGEIDLPEEKTRGMLTIGSMHEDYTASSGKAQIDIRGKWTIKGNVCIGPDCFIGVTKDAVLEIGNGTYIGRNSQIHCSHDVKIGNDVFCGETYITDSTEHQIVQGGMKRNMLGSVVIGEGTYMGFRTMILKDAVIPPHSVVGSGAVCTKDYTTEGKEKVLLVGVPAVVKTKGVEAIK